MPDTRSDRFLTRRRISPAPLLLSLLLAGCAAATGTLPGPVRELPPPRRFKSAKTFDRQARLELSEGVGYLHGGALEQAVPIFAQLCADVTIPRNQAHYSIMQGTFQLKALTDLARDRLVEGRFWLEQGSKVRGIMWGRSWEIASENLVQDIIRFLEQWPPETHAGCYHWASLIYGQIGEGAMEVAFARRAVTADLTSADLQYQLANALLRHDRAEESLPWFKRAADQPSPDPRMLSDFGSALCVTGQEDEAARVLERAVAADPKVFEAHLNLMIAYYLQGDLKGAEEVYREARNRFGDRRDLLEAGALYFLLDGDRDEEAWRTARGAGRELMAAYPWASALWALAQATAGRSEEARATVQELVTRIPSAGDTAWVRDHWFLRRRLLTLYESLLSSPPPRLTGDGAAPGVTAP